MTRPQGASPQAPSHKLQSNKFLGRPVGSLAALNPWREDVFGTEFLDFRRGIRGGLLESHHRIA